MVGTGRKNTDGRPKYTVLFVCTGNTCRSPMAAAVFAQWCRENGLSELVSVSSAGISPVPGSISLHARKVLAGERVPLEQQESRRIDPAATQAADLIVTMAGWHREAVLDVLPDATSKVRGLMSFAGIDEDVSDPYGGTEEEYRQCLQRMKPALNGLLEHVKEALGEHQVQ